jgi:hypothetical protein
MALFKLAKRFRFAAHISHLIPCDLQVTRVEQADLMRGLAVSA